MAAKKEVSLVHRRGEINELAACLARRLILMVKFAFSWCPAELIGRELAEI